MQTINLYRYTRPDGGVTVSTYKPDVAYTELYRLMADEGYVLTNGVDTTPCIDTAAPEDWTEVPDDEAPTVPDKATAADYQAALAEMGVEV